MYVRIYVPPKAGARGADHRRRLFSAMVPTCVLLAAQVSVSAQPIETNRTHTPIGREGGKGLGQLCTNTGVRRITRGAHYRVQHK